MNSAYLTLIKWMMYLYRYYLVFILILFVVIGFFRIDDRFIGCEEGSCSFLWTSLENKEFEEGEYYIEKVMLDGEERLIRKKYTGQNGINNNQIGMPTKSVKVIHPILNIAFILYYLFVLFLVSSTIKIIKLIEQSGAFDGLILSSIKKLVKGFIVVIIVRELLTIALDVFTDNGITILSLNSEVIFKIFTILLILVLAEIIAKGITIKAENDLTI